MIREDPMSLEDKEQTAKFCFVDFPGGIVLLCSLFAPAIE